MNIDESIVYRANPNFIARTIADQPVLVSIGDVVADFCGVIQLNESALLLWDALKESATLHQLVDFLTKHYAVSKEEAQQDVREILDMLLEKGMITHE